MPTPHELEVAKRQDVLRRHGNDFYVQEVVELMDSDDTDAGEEDLPRDERTSARKARRAEAARARGARPRRGPPWTASRVGAPMTCSNRRRRMRGRARLRRPRPRRTSPINVLLLSPISHVHSFIGPKSRWTRERWPCGNVLAACNTLATSWRGGALFVASLCDRNHASTRELDSSPCLASPSKALRAHSC